MHAQSINGLYSIMKLKAADFLNSRRGAVAVIFAICLVPMVLLVALSIDYAFYVQARAQTIAAADAAASNAVRAADNIYTFESSPGEAGKYANPKSDAEQDGAQIGKLWFAAALGTVPTSNVPTPSVTVGPNSNGTTGFTATVNFSGTYPPFFDSLFHTSKPWNLNGTAEAASDYNFVEIVMLLDNSSSMLIGASGNISATSTVSNVQAVENISVCPNSQYSTGGNGWSAYDASVPGAPALDETGFVNYIKPTSGTEGTCKDGYGNPGDPNMINGQQQYFPNGDKILNPYAPCAFACHTTSTATFTANGNTYTEDYFGLAQQAGATLRLNVLQQAAGNVITALQTNQQADGQFTVGVYLFNNDVSAVYPTNPASAKSEAGTDLTTAASDITSAPIPVQANAGVGNTDFVQSLNHLVSGNFTNGYALKAGGSGKTSTTPQKDIFIVTDGMEDNTDTGTRLLGEMTSYNVETEAAAGKLTSQQAAITPGLCNQLKKLNFTVYVLYIDYNTVPNNWFHTSAQNETPYEDADYSSGSKPTIDYAETASESADPTYAATPPSPSLNASPTPSPDEVGLEGCASSPADFIEASSDSEITTGLEVLLHSALTSTIQITQ